MKFGKSRHLNIEEEARLVRLESASLRADMAALRADIRMTQIELNAFANQLKLEVPKHD